MNDYQYYRENNDELKSEPKNIDCNVLDHHFKFKTDNGVFSKDYLDYATRILLENYPLDKGKSLLDLGCGYGPVGIVYSTLYQVNSTYVDVNKRAVELTKYNLKSNHLDGNVILSDGFSELDNLKFDYIVTNPPIRAGKAVIYKMFEDAKDHLNQDGKLVIVIQEHHGAKSALKKLGEFFIKIHIIYKKKGFYVIEAQL